MHPALSVIFFTTLSGAGYGLLAWLAIASLLGGLPGPVRIVATLIALVLASAGLLASFWHLGKPMRAWRAFSQWRTSWLSREGVAAVLTYVPALLFAAGIGGEAISLLLLLCALATVACTAMIYASLKPIPAWGHGLVLPVYFGFALLCGGLLLSALVAGETGMAPIPLVAQGAIFLAALMGALKLRYWRGIDGGTLPATRGDAVGLPGREVGVFERPHTEANYITREMAFVVARACAPPAWPGAGVVRGAADAVRVRHRAHRRRRANGLAVAVGWVRAGRCVRRALAVLRPGPAHGHALLLIPGGQLAPVGGLLSSRFPASSHTLHGS